MGYFATDHTVRCLAVDLNQQKRHGTTLERLCFSSMY